MNFYCLLADAIAVLHFVLVAFVVGGMAAILAGVACRWAWVRNFWFRAIHLAMIAAVVAESLCGIVCPLTDWEDRLREAGGAPIEPGFLRRPPGPRSAVCRSVPCRLVCLLHRLWPGRAAGLHPGAAAPAARLRKRRVRTTTVNWPVRFTHPTACSARPLSGRRKGGKIACSPLPCS